MIHTRKTLIPASIKTVEYIVSPCIRCGSDDIAISEYDDEYGYISKAKCSNKDCGNENETHTKVEYLIEQWNKENDIQTVIEAKKLLIIAAKEDIKFLTVLKRNRDLQNRLKKK